MTVRGTILRRVATFAAVLLLLACFALTALIRADSELSSTQNANAESYAYDDVLRLHVIANSDSKTDQDAKYAVRDAILSCIGIDAKVEDANAAERLLRAKGAALQSAAESTLAANGLDYGVQLISGDFSFPDRSYGDTFYPKGEYSAVRVVLGDGKGQNWWCVMFPPLCIISDDSGEIEYKEETGAIKFESFFVRLWERLFG